MNKTLISVVALLLFTITSYAQFHTLNYPQSSPEVIESQKLGVTKITVSYSSPALRERDVWNNPGIIPQKGNPIAWRAGANLATTIDFTTDVKIEGQELKAGTYAFYIIPNDDTYTLLFAHNYQQWGSYYLDIEKDISIKVNVNSVSCTKTEYLDYEFMDRTENSLVIGLEWDEKRIPFKVEVDLNKTVVESLRKELRGINTNRWQAWHDASIWCLNHDTNLEEALTWVNRSINGGYGGFAPHRGIRNLTTRINLLIKLNKTEDLDEAIKDASDIISEDWHVNYLLTPLMTNKLYKEAVNLSNDKLKDFPETWYIYMDKGMAHYFLNDKKNALRTLKKGLSLAPEGRKGRLSQIIQEIEAGTFGTSKN